MGSVKGMAMADKLKKKSPRIVQADAPRKVQGYTVAAVATTDALQLRAMREPDIETGGGCNTRHLSKTGR